MQPTNIRNKKLSKLEAIRGFAALYVALGHMLPKKIIIAGYNISFFLKFGQEAVILFFLLSGFVIQYSYSLSKDKSFKTFFFKRFSRIYIPLFFVFISNYFLLYIENIYIKIDKWNLAGNILMLQDSAWLKPNVITDCFLGNAPLWSLSYEWWFYMLFFLIRNFISVKDKYIIYPISIFAATTYLILPNFVNRELMYLAIWWIGADIANIYIENKQITYKLLQTQLVSIFIIIIILILNSRINFSSTATVGMSPFLELRHFCFSLIIVISAILWKKFHWLGFNKIFGIFELIAPISFGIYISHWYLIVNAHYLDKFIRNETIKYTIYICVCALFSYIVERILYISINKWLIKKLYPNKSFVF